MSVSKHDHVPELTSDTKYYAVVTPQGEFLSTKTYATEDDAISFVRQSFRGNDAYENQVQVIPVWVTIRDAR